MTDLTDQISQAMEQASRAFDIYKNVPGKARAAFLRLIGDEINRLGDELIQTVMAESNLPEGRVRGEKDRTTGQLNKFADLLVDGSWVEATIDTGDPARSPVPKPDLRKLLIPLGPVVVFGAGNFPLAFSVAGGDTASALAGGNPVVVKGHPAHPKTSQLVANAIKKAVQKAGLPEGVFELIQDSGHESGQMLVQDPQTKAVGFTGSQQGGMALVKLAAQRPEPIPVFAEMGSVNPVIILPDALKQNHASIAEKLVASVNLGAGQFCTNPGLIITMKTTGFDLFLQEIANQLKTAPGSRMLSDHVFRNYRLNSEKMFTYSEVSSINERSEIPKAGEVMPAAGLVKAADFIAKPSLREEVFGPFCLVVVCDTEKELLNVVHALKGQLTATIQAIQNEIKDRKALVSILLEKCGRLLFNGFPTGVEVCAAMQHGGPFPASSDSRYTSVGVSAIKRFVRPVSYQNFPQDLLPDELKNENPLNIWRLVNNQWTKDKF
jgi:NADP-dependent aldehyde dehydrogenase